MTHEIGKEIEIHCVSVEAVDPSSHTGFEIVETEEVVDAEFYDPLIDQASGLLEEVGEDLETALNFIRQYQRAMHMLQAPDPNGHPVQLLLQKYNMNHKKPGSIAQEKIKELKAGK